jgi:excisionase family DNA binding protein
MTGVKKKQTAPKSSRTEGAKKPSAPAPDAERLLTLSEAAFRLGQVHRTTVMRWVKDGRLHCVRLSRKAILFEEDELDRFIRDHRSSG